LALQNYYDTYKRFPLMGFQHRFTERNNTTWWQSSKGSQMAAILPYMENQGLYENIPTGGAPLPLIDPGATGNSAEYNAIVQSNVEYSFLFNNRKVVRVYQVPLDAMLCPSYTGMDRWQWSEPYWDQNNKMGTPRRALGTYAVSIGSNAMPALAGALPDCRLFPGNFFGRGNAGHGNTWRPNDSSGVFARGEWSANFGDIVDGTSSTIAVGEVVPHKSDHHWNGWMHFNTLWTATASPINWPIVGIGEPGWDQATNPKQLANAADGTGCNGWRNWQTSQGFHSSHPSGAQFVFADGSVHFLSQDIDYGNYQRLGTRNDGQVADVPD
jgi:prepilin-type processing-associated H-X9-DG protein